MTAGRDVIYLDNHATTRLDPRVLEAMLPWLTERYGNAGSTTHEPGREARDVVEDARRRVAAAVGAEPREIVFTSGATESVNLALLGLAARAIATGGGPRRIVTLATEHVCVLDPLDHLQRQGWEIVRLPVIGQRESADRAGLVSLDAVAAAVQPGTLLVSVLAAHNEIGVVQDVAAIAAIAHAAGAVVHVDCAQAPGRLPVDVDALGADLASFSAHKCHGPQGQGVLYVRRRGRAIRLEPLVYGGGQERGLRSGTLDVAGIVGCAAALDLAVAGCAAEAERMRGLRDRLWERLAAGIPGLGLNGPPLAAAVRLANNLNVRVPGVDGQTLLATLAASGLAVSSGSACSSETPRPSHVLLALGLDEDEARSSLRFGLSRFTTAAEIDQAAERIVAAAATLRRG